MTSVRENRNRDKHVQNGIDNYAFDGQEESRRETSGVDLKNKSDITVTMETDVNDDDYEYNAYQKGLLAIQDTLSESYHRHRKVIWTAITLVLTAAYFVYFSFALAYRLGDEGSWRLLCCTVFVTMIIILKIFCNAYRTEIAMRWEKSYSLRKSANAMLCRRITKWVLRIGVFVAIVTYVVIDVAIEHPENLISVAGLFVYLLVFYVTSINPARVNWHTVYWGIALQYLFALIILRTQWVTTLSNG